MPKPIIVAELSEEKRFERIAFAKRKLAHIAKTLATTPEDGTVADYIRRISLRNQRRYWSRKLAELG